MRSGKYIFVGRDSEGEGAEVTAMSSGSDNVVRETQTKRGETVGRRGRENKQVVRKRVEICGRRVGVYIYLAAPGP